jgi:carboxyl-terminal processing protease
VCYIETIIAMKKLFLFAFVISILCFQQVNAQIPDDTDGRLYRLCKTWGYFKYFSEHKCELKWDTLLYTTVNQVLAAGNNEEFNTALMTMFNKVGNNSHNNPYHPLPDTNINFDNSWIDDPDFSEPVQAFLETFTSHIYPDTSTCLVKFNDGSVPGYNSYLYFNNDIPTMPVDLYDEAYRLTYMFNYWNIVNYYFPYRNLMDQPWDSTLYLFIPDFRQVSTIPEFHIIFLRLATKINDQHGFTTSTVLTSFFWGGSNMPQIV